MIQIIQDINLYVKRFNIQFVLGQLKTKTNTEISFSFWLTLFYFIPHLALTHRQNDGLTEERINPMCAGHPDGFLQVNLYWLCWPPWRVPPGTLASRGLEEPAHASRGLEERGKPLLTDRKTDGRTEKRIHSLRLGWRNLFSSCAVCCVSFWFWREKGFGSILVQIRIYYLEYNIVVVVR